MTSFTATWDLPYPDLTNSLCDGADLLRDLAVLVDAALDGFDTDAGRAEVVPTARVQINNEDIAFTIGTAEWESVNWDSTGITDLSASTTKPITIAQDSRWVGGFYFRQQGNVGTAGGYYRTLLQMDSDIEYRVRDNGTGFTSRATAVGLDTPQFAATTTPSLFATQLNTPATTNYGGYMYFYWFADV